MESEKFLFIQTAFPGDAILTLPALQKLKEINSSALIDVLCIPQTAEIFNSSPLINQTYVIDKKGKDKSIFATYRFVKKLKTNNYKRIYSAHRSARTSLMVLLLEAKESFGYNNSTLMHVYKHLIDYDSSKHEVQRILDLIGFKYDLESWKIKPLLEVRDTILKNVQEFLAKNQLNSGFIALAPGSVWNTKIYPFTYFKEIVEYFVNRGLKILLIGGSGEKEICADLLSGFEKNVVNSAGEFSILGSIELIKHARLLITNDSAPTHMGMCTDTRVLTIYCSTVPSFGFYPYRNQSSWISFDKLKCKPCGIHGYHNCPIKTFDCGYNLGPQDIIKEAEKLLND